MFRSDINTSNIVSYCTLDDYLRQNNNNNTLKTILKLNYYLKCFYWSLKMLHYKLIYGFLPSHENEPTSDYLVEIAEALLWAFMCYICHIL